MSPKTLLKLYLSKYRVHPTITRENLENLCLLSLENNNREQAGLMAEDIIHRYIDRYGDPYRLRVVKIAELLKDEE